MVILKQSLNYQCSKKPLPNLNYTAFRHFTGAKLVNKTLLPVPKDLIISPLGSAVLPLAQHTAMCESTPHRIYFSTYLNGQTLNFDSNCVYQ